MNRPNSHFTNFRDSSTAATVAWVIPDKYLKADNGIKEGIEQVAATLADGGFSAPRVANQDCKIIFTFLSDQKLSFKDLLYLASLLPLQLDLEPLQRHQHEDDSSKICFALKWTGAKDHADGKLDCKIVFHLGQWMLKICHKDEINIGDVPALAKKEWLIRL